MEMKFGELQLDNVTTDTGVGGRADLTSPWERFRASKSYDLLAASPLMLWLAFCLGTQWPLLISRLTGLLSGKIALIDALQLAAILGSFSFNVAMIYFLAVRAKPIGRSRGLLPRITAFAGAFLGNSILLLPATNLTLLTQIVSNFLIFGGCSAALFVLTQLGPAFAMLPEARQLNTSGPYALVRHPLYVFETSIYLGLMLQFQQPWAIIMVGIGILVMYGRSIFEEQVLEQSYPEYGAYRAQTARFIPGIF